MALGLEVVGAGAIVKALAPGAANSIAKALSWTIDEVKIAFNTTFSDHLATSKRRCSYVRTIINPDFDTAISDIYVNLQLKHGDLTLKDSDLVKDIGINRRLIISGTAGAGKSMVMRRLVFWALQDDFYQVPIFVDMRDLADPRETHILESLFKLVTPEKHRANRKIFDRAIEEDAFCFFLDGYDEVSPEHRDSLKLQLDDTIVRYPNISIVMSSRPDVDFSGWDDFRLFHIQKIDREQSREIIDRSDFSDRDLKRQFVHKLESGEFDEFSSFLEIPLLNVILLICYGEFLYLSEQSSSFYDQAFEVLYRRHDRTKGLRRKHFAGLSYSDFRSLLNAFCFRSLTSYQVSFTEEELSNFLIKASSITGITVDPVALSQDLVESVSLMQRDGLKIFFIHRSFQEYFAVRFVVSYRGAETFNVYNALMCNGMSNHAPRIAAELDVRSLERDWVLPSLEFIIARLDGASRSDALAPLWQFVSSMSVHEHPDGDFYFGGYSWGPSEISYALRALKEIYEGEKIVDANTLLSGRKILISGKPLKQIFSETSTPDTFKNLSSDGERREIMFSAASVGENREWLSQTDVFSGIAQVREKLEELLREVRRRVEENTKVSVFD